KEIAGLMVMTMKPEIQRNLEPIHAHEMLKELKTLFAQQAEQELLQTTRDFHSCRQEEEKSVSSYVLKMKGYIDNLERLGHPMGKTFNELHAILKLHEQTLPKSNAHALNAIRAVWGCEALVKRDTVTKPDKLEPRAIKCIFVGYPKETMGYSFYYPPENKVIVARNAEFLENSLIDQEASGSLEDLEIIQEEDTHLSLDTNLNHEEEDLEIDEPQSDIIPIRDLGEPANYKAALLDPESEKWLNAMNVEMQSMKDNEVWVLVKLPLNGKTIGSKWLFKKKTDMDGNVHIYKAHLVAKGFSQTPRIDYEETFSLVADIRTIRILITIAAYYDYEIWKMDVKTAFLNGYLNEKVYMEQPEGFVNPKYPNRVCKLKRSIYGLKQASRQWNKRFDDEIKKFGFTQNRDEPCVYIKASVSNITFLILYVDDILLMGNSIPMLQSVKTYLGKCFAMKDLGDLKRELKVSCYTDARYLTDADDLKSQTGYVFVLNGGVVNWKSAKQSIFATSSAEAKYIAAFDASKEAVWVRKFISGLSVVPTIEEPISMYCDNTGAIAIANESGITKGARHFCAKVYYLREVIEFGDIKLEKVHTDDNLSDPFTIALAFPKHSEHTKNIGMLSASSLIKTAKIEKQMNAKLAWIHEKYNHHSKTHIGGSSSQTHEIGDVYLIAEELHQLHINEEALRETLEEQTMDEKAWEEKITQKQVDNDKYFMESGVMRIDSDYDLDINDSDLHLTHVLRSSSSTHVEPSPYTPNPVTIIPGPASVLQLSNSICVEPSSSTPNPVRIIPDPAGLVQRAKLLKENVFILDPDGALMSTQEYMQKVVKDVGEDTDFNSGAWVSATNYVNAFGGTVTGCLRDIDNFLKKEKLEQVVAIVKSCSSNALGDLNVILKDLSDTVPGTIHYKVFDVGSYEKDITV
nr:hypothetical protein [Tanacetum cinerariifolium]